MTATHYNPVVGALNSLSILGPHQGGAYREHSKKAREILGDDIATRAITLVRDWVERHESGVLILTGNAGTGKTALAESFCAAAGCDTPRKDALVEARPGVFVCKDLSGVGVRRRGDVVEKAGQIASGANGLMLLCANEGVLRPLVEGHDRLEDAVTDALLGVIGRSDGDRVLTVNMNRQKWTGREMWERLLNYVVAEHKWEACEGCPAFNNCPMRANAAQLRQSGIRESLREVFRLAAAEEVAPLRELLSVLSYGVTGQKTCSEVIDRNDRKGAEGFTAAEGYFHLVLGGGLPRDKIDTLPVLQALDSLGIGDAADLQVDAWLREASNPSAPRPIQVISGLERHVFSQVAVGDAVKTFAAVGELITISADQRAVEEALSDMLPRNGRPGFLPLWRRRVFFEAHDVLGGIGPALGRLSRVETFGRMLDALADLEIGREPVTLRTELVKGLNYLVCGMSAVEGYMYLPDPGITAARDLGSLLPAPPLVVVGTLAVEGVHLSRREFPDADLLDTDVVDLILAAIHDEGRAELILSPTLFNTLLLASAFRTPAGPDAADLGALELFYSRLGIAQRPGKIQIAERGRLRTITAPDMEAALDGRL